MEKYFWGRGVRRMTKKISKDEDKDADKFDPHIVCFSWPNCDEFPLGCVVRNGLDAEPYGHRD